MKGNAELFKQRRLEPSGVIQVGRAQGHPCSLATSAHSPVTEAPTAPTTRVAPTTVPTFRLSQSAESVSHAVSGGDAEAKQEKKEENESTTPRKKAFGKGAKARHRVPTTKFFSIASKESEEFIPVTRKGRGAGNKFSAGTSSGKKKVFPGRHGPYDFVPQAKKATSRFNPLMEHIQWQSSLKPLEGMPMSRRSEEKTQEEEEKAEKGDIIHSEGEDEMDIDLIVQLAEREVGAEEIDTNGSSPQAASKKEKKKLKKKRELLRKKQKKVTKINVDLHIRVRMYVSMF